MRPFLLPLAAAAVSAALAAPAAAQTPPPPPAPIEDAAGKALGAKTDALSREARALVEAYTKALGVRVKKLAEENPTLKRLHTAGVFSVDGLLAGVPSEPLAALPEIRRVYEELEKTAQSYVQQFGGVARQRGESAAAAYMLKVIQAQTTYREDDKDGNGILEYAPSFYDLGQTGVLHVPPMKRGDQVILVEGYKFRIVAADTLHWAADAAPFKPGESGDVWLYADQTGVIRAESGKPAGSASPVYQSDKPKSEKGEPGTTPGGK